MARFARHVVNRGSTPACAQGVEDKPWVGQGLRFGLAVWFLTSVAGFLTYYAVQPWGGDIVVKQILYELPRGLVLGLAAAAIYRK